MDKSNTLYRSDTYPYEVEKSDRYHKEFFETIDGWYSVIIDKTTDDFVLTTHKDKQIEDCLTEIHKRKELYDHHEDGMVYQWLKMLQDKINKARVANGESNSWFIIDGVKYRLRINTGANEVLLTIPVQTRVFNVKTMYVEYGDLPILQDGLLDDELRKRLQRKGFELPRVPYKVGLGISPKIINE